MRRNASAQLAGLAGRIVTQGLSFVLAARALGPEEYGTFVAATALATALSAFSGLGAGPLLIRRVAGGGGGGDSDFFAAATKLTISSGILLTGLFAIFAALLLPAETPLLLILSVALSELVLFRIVDLSGMLFQARDRSTITALMITAAGAVRLIGVVAVLVLPLEATASAIAIATLAGAAPLAIACWRAASAHIGSARGRQRLVLDEWRRGTLFSVSVSAQSVYTDIDKVMLARLAPAGDAGIYTAAYRLVDIALQPARAVLAASYPRFFRLGARGLPEAVAFAKRLLPWLLVYGLAAAFVLFFGAGLLPLLLGEDYRDAIDILRLLLLIPLIRAVQSVASDALTGADMQGSRTVVQAVVAGLNIGLNAFLIPALGIRGAVLSSVACEAVLCTAMWALMLTRSRVRQGK